MVSLFWLSLSVALFAYEWFNRSLRTLAITIAVTLAAIFAILGATFSQAMFFSMFGMTLNLLLVEIWDSLKNAEKLQNENQTQHNPEPGPVTVKVIRWNPDDTAVVFHNGRTITVEKESPFIRESDSVDIVKRDGQWIIVKAQ